MKGLKMNQTRKFWSAVVLIGFLLGVATVQAEESKAKFPQKRHVVGNVMSVTLPSGPGQDGEINVSEKVYRVTPKTLLLDQEQEKTTLDAFKPGTRVYMIVDLFESYREALYIAPK
jgi:hypothetical protein